MRCPDKIGMWWCLDHRPCILNTICGLDTVILGSDPGVVTRWRPAFENIRRVGKHERIRCIMELKGTVPVYCEKHASDTPE
jgi:hypothetical protein